MLSLTNQNKVQQPRGQIYRHISERGTRLETSRRVFASCPSKTVRYSGDPEQPGRLFFFYPGVLVLSEDESQSSSFRLNKEL